MTKTFSRQELYELVWTEPMLSLSKKFDISDVGLRKICKRHGIPLPKVGHWQKVRAGRKVKRPELPIAESDDKITLIEMEKGSNRKVYPWTQRQLEIESDSTLNLVVPEKLRRPNEEIVTARRALLGKESKSSKYPGIWEPRGAVLDIAVGPRLIRRALAFMDTFINLIRARGHEIDISQNATHLLIKERSIRIQIRERSKVVKNLEGKWPSRDFVPSGVLVFKADGYHGFEWADGARKVEDKLSNIVARLETSVEDLLEIWRENAVRKEEERLRLQKIQDEEDRKDNELKKFKDLLNQALRWKQVATLREFLAAHEARDTAKPADQTSWLEWAVRKANWYDPFIESDDELLADVDRESLTRIPNRPLNEEEMTPD